MSEHKNIHHLDSKPEKPGSEETKKETKLLAAPKVEVKQPKQVEKLVGIFDEISQKISFIEREISTQTFLIAHGLILFLGLAFLFGFYLVVNDFKLFAKSPSEIVNYQTITKKPTSFNLEINNPEDNFLTFENTILVSGRTLGKAKIIISTNSQDFLAESNSMGDFSKVINLDPGLNEITVNAFDVEGNQRQDSLNVYFSEEAL
jgi:hypothetical protein